MIVDGYIAEADMPMMKGYCLYLRRLSNAYFLVQMACIFFQLWVWFTDRPFKFVMAFLLIGWIAGFNSGRYKREADQITKALLRSKS